MLIDRRSLPVREARPLPSVIVSWNADHDATAIVTALPDPSRPRRARRWWLAAGLGIVAAAVVVGVGITGSRSLAPPAQTRTPPPPQSRVEIATPAAAPPPEPVEVIPVEAAPPPPPVAAVPERAPRPKARPPKKTTRARKPEPAWDPKSLFLREAPR